MKQLLFEYGELPANVLDLPLVEYNYELNLNVLKSNGKPAVDHLDNIATQTITRTFDEVNDTDDESHISLGTKTLTLVDVEQTDSDEDVHNTVLAFMDTMTRTKVEMESTDQD